MTSYRLMTEKTLIDLHCHLIKYGLSYSDIMQMPYHTMISMIKWFSKNDKEEKKAEHEYTMSILKAYKCPLLAIKR